MIPSLAIVSNRFSIKSTDCSDLFIPVPTFEHQEFAEDSAESTTKKRRVRMINKLVAMVVTIAVVFLQYLVEHERIPFPQQDSW